MDTEETRTKVQNIYYSEKSGHTVGLCFFPKKDNEFKWAVNIEWKKSLEETENDTYWFKDQEKANAAFEQWKAVITPDSPVY